MERPEEARSAARMKCDLLAERHVLTVVVDGVLQNFAAERLVRHSHGQFEVQAQWDSRTPESGSFRIIPPGVWHMGVLRSPDDRLQVTAFSFSMREKSGPNLRNSHGTALNAFLGLTGETPVPDTFGGVRLLQQIRRELQQPTVCPDRVYALIHLLMVELALHLPCYEPARHTPDGRQEDWLPEQIERMLTENLSDPAFSRERMAQRLNYSQRQLSRMLDQLYGKTFRQILLERRMEFAEGWRVADRLSAAETARKVGYASVRGFCNAYEKYHGKRYKEETD